jgi:hypothetical protein
VARPGSLEEHLEKRLKHLDFIQGVINRLSTNSFLLKGWSVVLVSALFALSATSTRVTFVFLAYVPAFVFWGLDGYFILLERVYRQHYDRVRTKSEDEIDFSMDINDLKAGFREWADATMSKTLLPFHGALLAAIVIVMFLEL